MPKLGQRCRHWPLREIAEAPHCPDCHSYDVHPTGDRRYRPECKFKDVTTICCACGLMYMRRVVKRELVDETDRPKLASPGDLRVRTFVHPEGCSVKTTNKETGNGHTESSDLLLQQEVQVPVRKLV